MYQVHCFVLTPENENSSASVVQISTDKSIVRFYFKDYEQAQTMANVARVAIAASFFDCTTNKLHISE
jgi:hypothetical protein